ncbi:MAG: hypothetical protein IPK27_14400 [Rhodanobacteraceae bacterium]|nr:hypothetical protein [Rhodanobacteraceae bacterium]
MNAATFCGLTDAEKRAHVATLSNHQRRKLIDAVADYHQSNGNPDPFKLKANAEFREWAAKRAPR